MFLDLQCVVFHWLLAPRVLVLEWNLVLLKLQSWIFSGIEVLNGILVGKPMDETYADDYKKELLNIVGGDLPVLFNLNIGHATPRAIVPFGVHARVDADKGIITFENE